MKVFFTGPEKRRPFFFFDFRRRLVDNNIRLRSSVRDETLGADVGKLIVHAGRYFVRADRRYRLQRVFVYLNITTMNT